MHKILIALAGILICITAGAQNNGEYNGIKLYVPPDVFRYTYALPESLKTRLINKINRAISTTGIVESGYSSFEVIPKFDVVSYWEDKTGPTHIYLVECELNIFIQRRALSAFDRNVTTIFHSYSKKVIGSSTQKDNTLASAVSSINTSDSRFLDFFKEAKKVILKYYKDHCKEVMAEADRALKLNDYAAAISLYFSVPDSNDCHVDARKLSFDLYAKYLQKECSTKILRLEGAIARAQNTDSVAVKYYDSMFNMVMNMHPALENCFPQAKALIQKIENRFTEKQKQEWEIKKKKSSVSMDVRKEMIDEIYKLNRSCGDHPRSL
jgi:hypothetical protein